jgi:DNA-binding transcriptional MerR regulator
MQTVGNRIQLSAKDVAMVIMYPGQPDGLARAMRQVRHWTQCDLLQTINDKHTGRGRSRMYDEESSILLAAMLMELSRFGVTVDKMKYLADWFYEDWEADSDGVFFGASTGEWNGYILIDWNIDPQTGDFGEPALSVFSDEEYHDYDETARRLPISSSATILNLNLIHDRLQWDYLKRAEAE